MLEVSSATMPLRFSFARDDVFSDLQLSRKPSDALVSSQGSGRYVYDPKSSKNPLNFIYCTILNLFSGSRDGFLKKLLLASFWTRHVSIPRLCAHERLEAPQTRRVKRMSTTRQHLIPFSALHGPQGLSTNPTPRVSPYPFPRVLLNLLPPSFTRSPAKNASLTSLFAAR